ncbi:cation diffusion facilitator family transporter [Jiella sp. MQZ9-1]|uniref:Cation transporter n=1 Tax=Jiella flava TaxID=2816857 RepID=A0A939G0I5_9HYPH|nr:cation diffusion facilitator family transporter [Jiella flava]MBO0662942.1 cation transporter [Jiella flava]MCD2471298.1 cation diffusion facilitator family transporter [Jiella flava]
MARSTGRRQKSEDDGSKKAVYAAMFANLAIAVTKFVAAIFSGSSSMLAEGIHSVIDTANEGFLLLGLARSKKPADEKHPFGYGVEVYFWSFVVAILIFALGAGFSIFEGVEGLISGESSGLESPLIALIVLGLAFCIEGYSWTVAFKEFQQRRKGQSFFRDFRDLKDPSVFVVLFEDSAACIGVVIAAIGISLAWATGIAAFDAVGSILIGLLLAVTAILLAIETKGLLIGESAGPELEKTVHDGVKSHPAIEAVNELRTLHLGPNDVLLTMSVDFKDDVPSQDIERAVSEIEARVRDRYPMVKRVFVEVQSRSGHAELARRELRDAEPTAAR